jgi:hypothetical protein
MKKQLKINMAKKIAVLDYIDFGIFPGGVTFTNGFSADEVIKQFKKQKLKEYAAAFETQKEFFETANYAAAKVYMEENGEEIKYFFLFTKEYFRFTDYEMVKLAHECLHICQWFLVDILNRNKESEAEAYLHSHIMTACLKILRSK